MRLIVSESNVAAENCSLEEQLLGSNVLSSDGNREEYLLIYINRPSVVVGRNQTVESEVDTAYCHTHSIDIVRRLSGGGTVWHDSGNVNWAFILNRTEQVTLDTDFTSPVVAALGQLGLEAHTGERKEIIAGGRKISGTAAHFTRDRVLFHGTLLYNSDLCALHRALNGDRTVRKGVASVHSEVANVAELTGSTVPTQIFARQLSVRIMSNMILLREG